MGGEASVPAHTTPLTDTHPPFSSAAVLALDEPDVSGTRDGGGKRAEAGSGVAVGVGSGSLGESSKRPGTIKPLLVRVAEVGVSVPDAASKQPKAALAAGLAAGTAVPGDWGGILRFRASAGVPTGQAGPGAGPGAGARFSQGVVQVVSVYASAARGDGVCDCSIS